jgi:hypothetical protein
LSGNVENRTTNFFLLVAELQKLNDLMAMQIRLTEKNLDNAKAEDESTQAAATILKVAQYGHPVNATF